MKYAPFLALIVALGIQNVSAQYQGNVYHPKNDAYVKGYNGKEKRMAWGGGVNQPQFAMGDLNRDGKPDLVIFERGYGVKTFIATGTEVFRYDSKYEAPFHEHFEDIYTYIGGYLKLIDYNRDGTPDMITRGYNGIGAYRGYYKDGMLHFDYYKDLRYADGSGTINAYVEPMDIPGAADIDYDGDIDFISYFVLGSQIVLYKNCQVEEGLPKDSIKICVEDGCWSKTLQYYERTQDLGVSCGNAWRTCPKPGRGAEKTTHSGNTLCLIDMDGDGDLDHLNGNVSYPDIQYFKNGRKEYGVAVDSAIEQDTVWGANGKDMYMPYFPAAFALDVDSDGDVDLLFSPNADNTENYKSVSYFKNTGNNLSPNYQYQSDTFLVDQMIDKGIGSYPVLYDYNKDGLKDLFVGSDGYYQPSTGTLRSSISYYKNTTNQNGISFELVTDNFLDIFSLDIQGTAIAIGDIDNDSLDDLIIGKTDGTFMFYKNNATAANVQPDWTLSISQIKDQSTGKVIDVGDYATPFIYDVDKDGKMDLLSGNQIGDLYYFNNFSTQQALVGLKEITTNFGGVKIFDSFQAYSYSAPYIGPMDNTGIDYLVVGSYWGELFRFDGFQSGTIPAQLPVLDSNYSWITVRNRATPFFANLDNDADNLHELIIGNVLGGVHYYQQNFPVSVNGVTSNSGLGVLVYPNPADDQLSIRWNKDHADESVSVRLVSVTGQVMYQNEFEVKTDKVDIDISQLPSGMYYCVVQTASDKSVKPISIIR